MLGLVDCGSKLRREKLSFRIGPHVDRFDDELFLVVVVRREKADEAAAAQRVARLVDGDAREPRFKLGAALELRQVRVRLNERILGHGVRFHLIADDRERHAEDLPLKALDQNRERVLIAGQCAFDQFPIGRSGIGQRVQTECCNATHSFFDAKTTGFVYLEARYSPPKIIAPEASATGRMTSPRKKAARNTVKTGCK